MSAEPAVSVVLPSDPGRFDDWCADDAERVEFLRSQNDALRAANVNLAKLCDRAVATLHENGLHADADDIERLASPF